MKALLKKSAAFALSSAMLIGFGRSAYAGPANPKHLAADTKWYAHLDLEAAKKTVIFSQVLDVVRAQFPLEDTLDQLKQAIGVNPLTDITAITVYNNSFTKDVAAVLIYAKVDQTLLANGVAQNPEYKKTTYGDHTIHNWRDANDGKSKTGCFYNAGLILMADKVETLQLAIDVLDGKKEAGAPIVKEPAKGAFFTASADLAKSDDQNVSKLLSNSEAATASASETEGTFLFNVNLTAKTSDDAAQIKKMVDGLKAFAQFGLADMPTAKTLLNQVKVENEGTKISAIFEHDSKTLLQTLQKLDQENKIREAKKTGGL